MDLMPVSDQSKNEQYYGNQEQPGGFRGIHGMAMMTVLGFVLRMWSGHGNIVDAPACGVAAALAISARTRCGAGCRTSKSSARAPARRRSGPK